ncbi:hypothetical protein D6825_01865 [Candidatus Woesearchaeota archaeon]|nr:MAG: hypothetical protein D6825_01865 [Candidatus Woesearchaeota archaeon]
MRIQNYREPTPAVRIVVPFSVAYGSNIDKVRKIALEVIRKNKFYDPKGAYTDVLFTQMGDFALNLEARFWVRDWKDAYTAKVQATEDLYKALEKNKIEIPFPTQTVYLKKK